VLDAECTRLLTHLRAIAGDGSLVYTQAPVPLAGGFETRTYSLRLSASTPPWAGPLVLRVLPPDAPPKWLAREAALLRRLRALDFPVPGLLDACDDAAICGGHFLVMERLAGTDLLSDAMPHRISQVTPTLAALQARLHALEPGALRDVLGTIDEPLADLEIRIDRARLDGFSEGLAWLCQNLPPIPRMVVCHGDFHPRNVLVRGGVVTGVIDWSLALLAAPEFDVGSARTVLAYAPADLPGGLGHLVSLFQRLVVAPRYERQYRRRRPVDARAVRYYEALRAFRCLVWAGESSRLAEGMTLAGAKPGPWDAPRTAALLSRRFRRLTGVRISLPAVPRPI